MARRSAIRQQVNKLRARRLAKFCAAPFGRIAFANTDLAGAMDHRFSILEAHRAVNQLLDQVLT